MPIGHEDAVALLEEGATPYMRKAVNDFQASVDRVHGSEDEVSHALSDNFADDNQVSRSLIDLEEDAEDIGESAALPVPTPSSDFTRSQEKAEEASLEKATKLAKKAETTDTKKITTVLKNIKTQAEIKKMADDAEAKIKSVEEKAGISTETKLGESKSKFSSSFDQIMNPKTSSTSKYTAKITAPVHVPKYTAPPEDDKAEIEKLSALQAKLTGNLKSTEKSMTSVEKTFEKNTRATMKMQAAINSFKKEADKAKSFADGVSDANDELGDASTPDVTHEMDQVVQMTKKSGAVGVSKGAARHLEEDYHRVASKYVNNLQSIMNEWKSEKP